jgi:RNA polymerase sigma-70 factor (ECF subfamily)
VTIHAHANSDQTAEGGAHAAAGDDAELVRRAQAGDRSAFVALYQRYVQEIYGFFTNQLGDPQEAEDLTSETFLRLVRGLDQFAGRASFRTWLYEIARNQARDHWRRNGRHPVTALDADRAADPPVDAEPSADPGRERYSRAIFDALPPNYQAVLRLRVLDGRSVRDSADELGISESNVKVLTHRALRRAVAVAEELGGLDYVNGTG